MVNALNFGCEAFMVGVLTLLANDVTRVCPDRSPYQVTCPDMACTICLPGYLNCNGLIKMHAVGCYAYELIRQMPSSRRHDIMSDGNGLFWATDMDWDAFHRDDNGYGKFGSFGSFWVITGSHG